ncbi:neoverrucotoxin subunit beta-like, partial [Alligator sinensis]|uniref:Neoverrucotoxin subunit beta-like n=1 Tax=Alligator sinensis TaxID=38654 RepID=A0A3Q0FVJ5_ALLSI
MTKRKPGLRNSAARRDRDVCGHRAMDSSDDTIEMSALGRPFQLGMLYDCRKETLIPGISLWDLDTLRNDVDTKPQSKTEFQIIASDTIDAKASALNITTSLKASFFCGLVK